MAGDDGAAEDAPLPGVLLSADYLRATLRATSDPLGALDAIQRAHAPRLQSCEPALSLLELVGFRRVDLYRDLLEALKGELFKGLRAANSAALSELLLETLPFLSFGPPLEEVPIKVLAALPNAPDEVLETLSSMDQSVLDKLPRHARQQVWERFPETFQTHMDKLIERYLADTSALTWSEEMNPDTGYPPPHKRRQKNTALQEMVRAIGSSPVLYRFACDEARERFAATGNARFCALRADILMALHDVSAQSILVTEPCHHFAWHLDAYVKQIQQNGAAGTLDMKTVELQGSVIAELSKVMEGIFKPSLQSAFAGDAAAASELGGLGGGALGGLGLAGRKVSGFARVSTAKKGLPVDLPAVLLEALRKVKAADRQRMFLNPVVESFPHLEKNYLAVIKKPMDLTTIEGKIVKRAYASVDEMRADLHLIADNSRLFNGEKSNITLAAVDIMKIKGENYLNIANSKYEHARLEQRLAEKQERQERAEAEVAAAAAAAGAQQPPQDQPPPPQAQPQQDYESESAEAADRRRKAAAAAKRATERRDELDALVQMEGETRQPRAVSDAAMILASGFTVNALTVVLFYLVSEEVIAADRLPRDAPLTRDVAFLLQSAGLARELVVGAQAGRRVALPVVSPVLDKQVLPALAAMLLDSAELRVGKVSADGGATVEPLNAALVDWCKRDWIVRNAMLHFFCDRVARRDRSMVLPLLQALKQVGPLASDHAAFLHSLVTSFFIGSHGGDGGGGSSKGGRASGPLHGAGRNSGPPHGQPLPHAFAANTLGLPLLPPEIVSDAIRYLYLPAVVRASAVDQPQQKTARYHTHLSRLLTLEFTLNNVAQAELLQFARAAILALAGGKKQQDGSGSTDSKQLHNNDTNSDEYEVDANIHVLGSEELKRVVLQRYSDPSFERAHRQYEKLFRRFPNMRTACGLPPPGSAGPNTPGLPSPSPSPFSPSPSPSPMAPSPFDSAETPGTASGTDANGTDASPRKRPLDALMEGAGAEDKRAKTDEEAADTPSEQPGAVADDDAEAELVDGGDEEAL
jgi:hypothetical protein